MKWLLSRVDSFLSTATASVTAIGASQFLTFIQQYRQRLGGHLAEAQLNLRQTIEGPVFKGLDQDAQRILIGPLEGRLNDLNEANTALSTAESWRLPWKFLQNADWDIASAALAEFQPAIPLDLTSVLYTITGLVLGWLIYDILKIPFRRRKSLHV